MDKVVYYNPLDLLYEYAERKEKKRGKEAMWESALYIYTTLLV
jgi:hypothetical protein